MLRFRLSVLLTLALLVPLGCSCGLRIPSREELPDLITVDPPVKEAVAAGQLSGADVLARCAKAYAALQSYVGNTSVSVANDYGPLLAQYSAQAKVWYVLPAKIRIKGKSMSGKSFDIISDGAKTWQFDGFQGSDYQEQASIKEAVSLFLGTAQGATIMIPACLLQIEWDPDDRIGMSFPHRRQLLAALATKAVLSGKEKIDGAECHRVVCEREIYTWTFWIDRQSFLLRKTEQRASPEQMSTQKRYGGGGFTGKIRSTVNTELYTIEAVNKAIDEKLFQFPPQE